MPTPTDISQDPNTITDPTGGQPNFNILDVFQEFGYQPTQAEIDSLSQSFAGRYNVGQIGTNAVAQYVNFKNQQAEFAKNDPLTALQTQLQDLVTQNQASVTGLSKQLQDTLSSAPQLFGDLTPDQISTYLAPLQTAFTQQLSQVQGTLAARGLGASSTEANALAQTAGQFQEQVLNTGLNIGLTSQQNKANALQAQLNNLFGQTNTALGIKGNAAQAQSSQMLSQSNLLASLPSFLNAQSAQENQIATAQNKSGGFQELFNQVTGDISQGANAFESLAMVPQQFKTSAGGNPNTFTPGSPNAPTGAPTSGIPSANYAPPNLNAPGYGEFAATGSLFGS